MPIDSYLNDTTNNSSNLLTGLAAFLVWVKWLLLLTIVISAADLKFGIDVARYNKETIRFSRAVRLTVNKISGFFLWIALSYLFGQAFGLQLQIPLLPLLMLLVIYISEIESLYRNYYAAKGKEVSIDLLSLLKRNSRN